MGKEGARLLVCALASIGLIFAGGVVMDWFVVRFGTGFAPVTAIGIDLRSAHACTVMPQACVSVPLSQMRGFYAWLAPITFYMTLAYMLSIGWQTVRKLVTGSTNDFVSKMGYLHGLACMGFAATCGYLFAPDPASRDMPMATVERTIAPALLLAGDFIGLFALYFAAANRFGETIAPVQPAPLPVAVAQEPRPVIERARREVPDSLPLEGVSLVEPVAPPVRVTPPREAIEKVASQLAKDALRGRLNYAVATAEITAVGIDARREDGASRIVLYRDVVGIVARRLPSVAPYDGSPFVDVISTADSTLRILPWTRLAGDAVAGENVARARALVQLLVERCGKARLDRATQRFLMGTEPPAQIPDVATLDQHDQRLA